MSLFEMPEIDFVLYYGSAVAIALLLTWLLRLALRSPGGAPASVELPVYEAAFVCGGPARAVHAALVGLVHRNLVTVAASTNRIYPEDDPPSEAHPLEQALHALEPGTLGSRSIELTGPQTRVLEESLERQGLLLPSARSRVVRYLTTGILAAVAVVGLVRISVDLAQKKQPVLIGIVTALPVAGAALAFLKRPDRSRRGDAVVAVLKQRHEALEEIPHARWAELSGPEIVLAVAVFGPGVLKSGPMARLRMALNEPEKPEEVPIPPPSEEG
jgi:uncharacterized protein (TIGR04222 family)